MTAADPDDVALVARALAGDQTAYGALMRRHRDAVYRIARGHVGDLDEALDVTQDSFIAAFAALPRYDRARSFRAWMARITLNKCRDRARRRLVRRMLATARPISEAMDVGDVRSTPEEALRSRLELDRIRAAVASLPSSLKDPLLLCAIEGMGQAEAAEILGTTVKAVETRLYRARLRLKDILRD